MTGVSGGRGVGAVFGALALAGTAAFAWGSLVERRMFTLRHETVPVLPKGAASVSILHLSDLHMAPWQHAKQDWVRSLARLKPDLIVDTGDNLGHEDGIPGIERAFADFGGIPGLYVHGSNDYYGPMHKNWLKYFSGPSSASPGPKKRKPRERNLDTPRLDAFFTGALGWQNLNNAVGTITLKNTRFEAPRDLRNRKVQIRFDRLNFDRAIVYFKGERMGEARPVDFVANDRKPSNKGQVPS